MKKQTHSFILVYLFILLIVSISSAIVFSETNYTPNYNITKLAIDSLESEKNEMELLGLRIEPISDYISLSKDYLTSEKYYEADQTIAKAEKTITFAYLLRKELPLLENNLYLANQSGIDIANASILYQNSKKELLLGNYDGSMEFMLSSKQSFKQSLEKHYSPIYLKIQKIRSDSKEFNISNEVFSSLEKEYRSNLDSLDTTKFTELSQKLEDYQSIPAFFQNMDDSINNFKESEKRNSLLFTDLFLSAKSNIEQSKIKEFKANYYSFTKNYEFYKASKQQMAIILAEIEKLDKNDLKFSNTLQLFDIVKNEYNKENYEKSATLSEELISTIQTSKSNSILSNKLENSNSWLMFLKSNLIFLIFTLLFLSVLTLLLYKPISAAYYKSRKLQLLKKIEVNITLVKSTQRKYFKEKKLSKENYEFFMDKYQEKIVSAREALFILEKLEKNKK